jgi:hypothetical protein
MSFINDTRCPSAPEQYKRHVHSFVLLEFYPPTDATTSSLFLDPSPYSRLSRFGVQVSG